MLSNRHIEDSWQRLLAVSVKSRIGIFVGAGASMPNKLPSWASLTANIQETMPRDESFRRVIRLQEKGVPLESQLAIMREQDGGIGTWITRVRRTLYGGFFDQLQAHVGLSVERLKTMERKAKKPDSCVRKFFFETNPVLAHLVDMCSLADETQGFIANPRVGAVLTTNLDALIQLCDRALHGHPRILRTIERASKRGEAGKISLYHLHGYLTPYEDAAPHQEAPDRIVLTELEYTKRNDNPNHWAAITLHWAFREFPIVFVGCSMTDSLVRRALYRSREERVSDAEAEALSGRLERRNAPKHFAVCLDDGDDDEKQMLAASFRLMDLNILWVKDFDSDLPRRVEALSRTLRKAPL